MSLNEKLYKIMAETKAIEKNLTIEFKTNKYSAVSESSVLNEIKPLLKKYKVIILPVGQDMQQSGNLTLLNCKWEIIDTESGESKILIS